MENRAMSFIFPKWTNTLPLKVAVGVFLVANAAGAGVWYYLTPKYTRVGYTPKQPVAFSHAIHAGQLGLDCRYCHNGVEKSWFSNIPSATTCMNCHGQVAKDSPKLELVRQSFNTGKPIPWVQIHKNAGLRLFQPLRPCQPRHFLRPLPWSDQQDGRGSARQAAEHDLLLGLPSRA